MDFRAKISLFGRFWHEIGQNYAKYAPRFVKMQYLALFARLLAKMDRNGTSFLIERRYFVPNYEIERIFVKMGFRHDYLYQLDGEVIHRLRKSRN